MPVGRILWRAIFVGLYHPTQPSQPQEKKRLNLFGLNCQFWNKSCKSCSKFPRANYPWSLLQNFPPKFPFHIYMIHMSSFVTGGPCATLHAFWISPLRQNWNCSEVRMLKRIQFSKHLQQIKLSQSLNYSITMSCSFASIALTYEIGHPFFSAKKWFLHKECVVH